MTSLTACRLAAALLAAGALIALTPARAQVYGGPPVPGGQPGTGRAPPPPRAPAPRAPALPGSHAASPVAPATRLPLDMPPTEALFDAINRGDLAAARDAISRGADLNGRNVLGLNPLELSVDLGRNEISFLLLSMRRIGGVERTRPVAVAEPAPARQRKHARERVDAAIETTPASAAAPVPGGGGAPVPSAGFLGFDFGRQGAR